MKKGILILLALTGLMSCKESGITKLKKENTQLTIDSYDVDVITIDSCEYLWVLRYKGAALTHKGNCNNPIHNYVK